MLSNRRPEVDEEKSLDQRDLDPMEDYKKSTLPSWRVVIQQVLANTVATVCNVVNAFAAGILLFPRVEQQRLGISMVMMSTAASQFVFAMLLKDVPLISLFILENVPMLHSMAMSTYHTLAHDHPQAVIPTVLALYTTASLLTALAFILLGYFKMQHLCNALPKPVLMGCLAGMGIYLFACGLGTSTAVEWDWTSETLVEQTRHWPKLLLTLGLEAVLLQALAMAKRIDLEALVLPTFFLAIIACSWIVLAMTGYSLQTAQANGWFFQRISTPEPYLPFDYVKSFDLIAWHVFPSQLPVLFGIVLFSVLHIPVNVPALSEQVCKLDMGASLMAHGVANLLSSCFGCLQTYTTFSISFFYYKCGGRGQVSGVLLSLMLLACIPYIPSIIIRLPRVVAGCLLTHIGVELIWESVIDTWRSLDVFERVILLAIAMVCNVSFVDGFLLGLFCAFIAFVVQASMSDPVHLTFYPGKGLRSRLLRSRTETQILEDFDQRNGFLIVRLQGVLFFGNGHALSSHLENVNCGAVIIDFAHVTSIDSSGFGQLEAVAKMLHKKKVRLICSGLRDMSKVNRFPQLDEATFVNTMEEGVRQMERSALMECDRGSPSSAATFPATSVSSVASTAKPATLAATASEKEVIFFKDACRKILGQMQLPSGTTEELLQFFEFQRAEKGTILWKVGDDSDFAFLLVSGNIGVVDDFQRVGGTSALTKSDDFVETCAAGHWVGELHLLTGESRKNKLLATEDLSMWTITKTSLQSMQQNAINVAFAFQSIALRFAAHRMYLSMLEGHVHSI